MRGPAAFAARSKMNQRESGAMAKIAVGQPSDYYNWALTVVDVAGRIAQTGSASSHPAQKSVAGPASVRACYMPSRLAMICQEDANAA